MIINLIICKSQGPDALLLSNVSPTSWKSFSKHMLCIFIIIKGPSLINGVAHQQFFPLFQTAISFLYRIALFLKTTYYARVKLLESPKSLCLTFVHESLSIGFPLNLVWHYLSIFCIRTSSSIVKHVGVISIHDCSRQTEVQMYISQMIFAIFISQIFHP